MTDLLVRRGWLGRSLCFGPGGDQVEHLVAQTILTVQPSEMVQVRWITSASCSSLSVDAERGLDLEVD
jgi:hypothetical protein